LKIVWSPFALPDRDGIFTHIEADNPAAAIAIDERIVAVVSRLRDFPKSGRIGRLAGTRELVIVGTPYIAAYRLAENRIRILRVFMEHSVGRTISLKRVALKRIQTTRFRPLFRCMSSSQNRCTLLGDMH